MTETIPEIFRYEPAPLPEDCIFNISPSQIHRFFDYPRSWYEENVLGEKTFFGNTHTVTGIIVHHLCKCAALGIKITREEVNDQLYAYNNLKPELGLDLSQIMTDYPVVAETVINGYVLPATQQGGLTKVEQTISTTVIPKINVGGTYDRLDGDCIVDFKIVGMKPNEQIIPFMYKIQLLSYAYILKALGYEINRIRIVYGVKPTKTLPARLFIVTETIDYVNEKMIRDTLKLIAETILKIEEDPSLTYLLFKSYDLKEV